MIFGRPKKFLVEVQNLVISMYELSEAQRS